MDSSTTFQVDYLCEVCGARFEKFFVEQDELILKGISIDVLNNISEFHPYRLDS